MNLFTFKQLPPLFLLLLMCIFSLKANAQKLPRIQKNSIKAPPNINIDGVLSEWANEKLQAYNTANQLYYTLCNDDKNLYLAILAKNESEIEKVLRGGITFTTNSATYKKLRENDTTNVTIKFPDVKPVVYYSFVPNLMAYKAYKADTIANRKAIDSLNNLVNKTAESVFKNLRVTGIKNVAYPQINVNNSYKIKASARFNRKMQLVCEIAIPLKYLNLSLNNSRINYSIQLTGPLPNGNTNALPPPRVTDSNGAFSDKDYEFINSTTSFWAEYILAN